MTTACARAGPAPVTPQAADAVPGARSTVTTARRTRAIRRSTVPPLSDVGVGAGRGGAPRAPLRQASGGGAAEGDLDAEGRALAAVVGVGDHLDRARDGDRGVHGV